MMETILAILQSTNFTAYTYMWLALVNRYFFDETFLCYKYIKLSHSHASKWHLYINYILYQLHKDIETARQMELLGGGGGKKTNLIDIMTYQKWSRAAKMNHMQALKKMARFWRALATESKMASAKPTRQRAAMLREALEAVSNAHHSYVNLLRRFPRSKDALELFANFVRQLYNDESRAELLLLQAEADDQSSAILSQDPTLESSSNSGGGAGYGANEGGSSKEEHIKIIELSKKRRLHLTEAVAIIGLAIMVVMGIVTHFVQKNEMEYTTQKMHDLHYNRVLINDWTEVCNAITSVQIYSRNLTDERRSLASTHNEMRITKQLQTMDKFVKEINHASNFIVDKSIQENMDEVQRFYREPTIRTTFFNDNGVTYFKTLKFQVAEYLQAIREIIDERAAIESPNFKLVLQNCIGDGGEVGVHIIELELDHIWHIVEESEMVILACIIVTLSVNITSCFVILRMVQKGAGEFDMLSDVGLALHIAFKLTHRQKLRLRKRFGRETRRGICLVDTAVDPHAATHRHSEKADEQKKPVLSKWGSRVSLQKDGFDIEEEEDEARDQLKTEKGRSPAKPALKSTGTPPLLTASHGKGDRDASTAPADKSKGAHPHVRVISPALQPRSILHQGSSGALDDRAYDKSLRGPFLRTTNLCSPRLRYPKMGRLSSHCQ
uniref:TmcB/TmcC TPR repeats domain-containing protein n=1 Tax=Vitrella brassicaformis TaxID=1169539 RepID=A0A7S1KB62_9ALVE|mmetsp:Transcript_46142/g.114778  ORF Transcript_46142/g.114778 Transcript_46142/m.114778 type:complete len:668 (+) Transcript_46142:1250-3253(+)